MIKRSVEVTPARLFLGEELPFYINQVSESYSLQLHTHEFTEICYVFEGHGFHYIGDETLSVTQGDLFVLPLGASHVFRPRSTDRRYPLVVYNFLFDAERMADALRGFPGLDGLGAAMRQLDLLPAGDRPEWRRLRDASGIFRTFFAGAYLEFLGRRTGFVPRIYASFIVLLTELERQLAATETGGASQPSPGALAVALDFIHGAAGSSVTAAQAAAAAQLSERQLHRLFPKATGFTFTQYVQNLRIERGCELLRSTRMTVQQVAEAVGYQDKGYFTDLFKKKTGLTPRAYRQR
ncbi:helix-turn-helix domain-containing protein [Cohnella nanjingensis]|uniref:Helix-turn-helix domain-containing protein n=1 Tax=Cohnella nanjingensis TaxID=1387779 RepID=A0A7X0VI90_9BACL|nr:helix-turn-helix domain-containing protein [Cohnella nanjingensis]MBB6674965.1 helix-turn-helix domain-containing protein [Cohnella nanjingensis]